ncbi:MAG TPA: dTDP-4-dehydrorhamnose reductase [Pseudorhodoplanes sp.]|nr:dTDP-4-dehydrorhamnose reductase [Pseudorhodoplanes sp.]
MIVVFGGAGQVGLEVTALARARGLEIAAFDHAAVDIADAPAVADAIGASRATFVVNCAAYNQVDRAEREVAAATRANVDGPAVLGEATARAGVPLLHISTDYVFPGDKTGAWTERDRVAPLSVYGRTKEEGERRVRDTNPRHYILRTAWVFGRHGNNFLRTVIELARTRDSLDMVADTRGSPTHSLDLARAILLAEGASRRPAPAWGTYHVAGEGAASRCEQAFAIVAAQAPFTGRSPRVNPVPSAFFSPPARRPANAELDSAKFAATFGFRPAPWRLAVERAVAEIFDGAAAP